jgi:signal transduction histidine kinase
VLFLVLLARKLARATPGGRRVVLPLATAGAFVAIQFVVQFATLGEPVNSYSSHHPVWFWVVTGASLAVPVSLAAGLLWGSRARAGAADLLVELERTPLGAVGAALARTLGDPTLELALWLPERRSYVDAAGRPFDLPPPGSDRAVTVLGPEQAPVAALVHDPVLLERRGLLQAAGAAARLALENERLHAELRAQLAELHASRKRIVSAGDEERRRLERNLHDGAQQRLLALGLALQLARGKLGPAANGAGELLDEADEELRAALDELRELARGIHPAVLTEQGLAAALRSIAERSPVAVHIDTLPDTRFPPDAEAAAFFLVSEALANVVKYAGATRVHISVARRDGTMLVEVDDDGVGGADPSRGTGLRGLADRIHALDGELRVESPSGRGTSVHATIPCA